MKHCKHERGKNNKYKYFVEIATELIDRAKYLRIKSDEMGIIQKPEVAFCHSALMYNSQVFYSLALYANKLEYGGDE